jgi:WD40 repeat protein
MSYGVIVIRSTGEPISTPLRHAAPVEAAVFDPKGESVVTASDDNTARIWDARTSEPIRKTLQHAASVEAAAFDPRGGSASSRFRRQNRPHLGCP